MPEFAEYPESGDTLFFFPAEMLVVRACEGTGDNLLDEDVQNGYVDYIDWTSYRISRDGSTSKAAEHDGGMVLFKEYINDIEAEQVLDALRLECGICDGSPYTVLNNKEVFI